MRRTPLTRALAGLAAGASLVTALSGCAAKPAGLEHVERHHSRTAAASGHHPADPAPARRRPRPDRSGCAFCAIVSGEIPAEIVYADDLCVAFLDHRPLFHGHVLLAPREHVITFADLPGGGCRPVHAGRSTTRAGRRVGHGERRQPDADQQRGEPVGAPPAPARDPAQVQGRAAVLARPAGEVRRAMSRSPRSASASAPPSPIAARFVRPNG